MMGSMAKERLSPFCLSFFLFLALQAVFLCVRRETKERLRLAVAQKAES